MKTKIQAVIAITAGLAVALSACSTQSNPEPSGSEAASYEKVTIKINTGVPPTHHLNQNVFLPWKDKVESATNGAVTVELYDANTLGSLTTALTDMSAGLYDVGVVAAGYFPNSPAAYALTVANLAAATPDQATGSKLLNDYYEANRDLIKLPSIDILGATVTSMYALWSKDPINSVADIKGMQIGVGSALEAETITMLGGHPVQVTPAESYQALERGTVDALQWPPESGLGFKIAEVAPYLFELQLSTTAMTIGVRDSLTSDYSDGLRELMEEELLPELPRLMIASYQQVGAANDAKISQLIADGDLTRTTISARDRVLAASLAEPRWSDWGEDASARGLEGDALVASWLKIMDAAGAERPF